MFQPITLAEWTHKTFKQCLEQLFEDSENKKTADRLKKTIIWNTTDPVMDLTFFDSRILQPGIKPAWNPEVDIDTSVSMLNLYWHFCQRESYWRSPLVLTWHEKGISEFLERVEKISYFFLSFCLIFWFSCIPAP